MIETLPEKATIADLHIPADVLAAFLVFQTRIRGRSLVVWAEHCSECAYPTCYVDCAFYSPRSDFHCRRFVNGIEPVHADRALHRIQFRKWGKLEGQGPVALLSSQKATALVKLDQAVSQVVARAPAPFVLKQMATVRWNKHKARERPGQQRFGADGFVVEAWSADGSRHPFTLTLLNVAETGAPAGGLFQTRFEVDADYRRLVVPLADISAQVDLNAPYLVQIEPVGDAEGVDVVFGVCDFVDLQPAIERQPAAAKPGGAPALVKVVVWDLDETLWTGVLGEDGVAGVRVRPEAAAAVKLLDERGFLQTIASKNNEAEALEALKAFGLEAYFLYPQIHWSPKSQSVAAQAKAFDLALDSFVFIDDQPFERAEVTSAHPMVRTLAHTSVADIVHHPWFDAPTTTESRQRRALYRQEAQRVEALRSAGEDYADFLRASEIKLRVEHLAAEDVERVYELSQRTNQLNFTGRKFLREEVKSLLAAREETGLVLRCSDRFGDYGLIGFAVAELEKGMVRELFLSCRVQRKQVEHAFFAWLAGEAAAHGERDLTIFHRPTGRNGAAEEMLRNLEFTPPGAGQGFWLRRSRAPIEASDIVSVLARSSVDAA